MSYFGLRVKECRVKFEWQSDFKALLLGFTIMGTILIFEWEMGIWGLVVGESGN